MEAEGQMADNLIRRILDMYPLRAGEYLPAYVARLLAFADFVSAQELFNYFGSAIPKTSDGFLPRWALLMANSSLLNKDCNAIIDEHLAGSFWRPFIGKDGFERHTRHQLDGKGTMRVLFAGEKPLTKFAPLKYCARCRDEEKSRLGFCIWQSHHQLATVFTCQKHGDVLHHKQSKDFPVPDGKSVEAFDQEGGVQPAISTFHRWLEFESNLIVSSECRDGNGMLATYRSVFLESSFFKGTTSPAGKRLAVQWSDALKRYLSLLFPHQRDEIWCQLQSEKVSVKSIMDISKPVHPLLLLLFKTFYMFQYRA